MSVSTVTYFFTETETTETVEIDIFYSFFTVTELNRCKCLSDGILSMLSEPYNIMYEPVSGENKQITLMEMLAS